MTVTQHNDLAFPYVLLCRWSHYRHMRFCHSGRYVAIIEQL